MAHTCILCGQTAGTYALARYVNGGAEMRLHFCNDDCAETFFDKKSDTVEKVVGSERHHLAPSKAERNGWQ